jgi:TPR repeat protein
MYKLFKIVVLILLSGVISLVHADLYEDAYTAYNNDQFEKAVQIWSSPELQDDARALFSLGRLYSKGEGVAQDLEKAVGYYQQAASLGHLSAQFNLGLAYYKGRGIDPDTEQAVSWWEKAAENGHDAAQYNLGALFWQGDKVPKDQATAMKWFRISLKNGNEQAAEFLYSLFEPMYTELKNNLDLYRNTGAERNISLIEELGMYKLAQQAYSEGSFEQAYQYWLPLAEDGHNDSQYRLGTLYESGEGVNKSFNKALQWYEKAAKTGQGEAQFRLGLYHMNEAPDVNKTLGLYWIQSAADNNNAQAQAFLDADS